MHGCCQHHDSGGCLSTSVNHRLPRRVINVGHTTSEVVLLETSGQSGKYAALSHCWGEVAKWTTTTSHPKLPEYEELPANFQDAITVTRELGLRYLWIDALCILEDSAKDWRRECADMFNIYRNAEVTISVRDNPSSSATGFIKGDTESP
jgi:hypothetical protein